MPSAVCTGRSRGRARMWWGAWSPVLQASMNGQAYSSPKVMPGSTTAGRNTLGISRPKTLNCQAGNSRSAPSSHPRYQSGWAGELTCAVAYGP